MRTVTHTIMTMGMATTTDNDDSALLQLIWLASPALPIGGFSYSEGIEAGVEWGDADYDGYFENHLFRNALRFLATLAASSA